MTMFYITTKISIRSLKDAKGQAVTEEDLDNP